MGRLKDGTEYAGVGDDDNDRAVEPDNDADDRVDRKVSRMKKAGNRFKDEARKMERYRGRR